MALEGPPDPLDGSKASHPQGVGMVLGARLATCVEKSAFMDHGHWHGMSSVMY